jgi:hypothetical protein
MAVLLGPSGNPGCPQEIAARRWQIHGSAIHLFQI